jgi:hypothetical protein
MAKSNSQQLQQRRQELVDSLPNLSQKRASTYRLSSDARALDRAGVKRHAPTEMTRLGEDEVEADAAIRDAQLELRKIDAEMQSSPRGGFGARIGRAVRRGRPDR